jgi:hypothetical protein
MVLEITDVGTVFYRLIDWLMFCIDGDLAVYQYDGELTDDQNDAVLSAIKKVIDDDMDYDYTFQDDTKYYCVENVVDIYKAAGIELCKPKLIKDIVGPRLWPVVVWGNWLYSKLTGGKASLPMDKGMYYVGNTTNGGLMASPHLVKVVEF